MTVTFREKIAHSLSAGTHLKDELREMSTADWEPLAEIFAAKLPEFDATYALPGAETLARQVAQIRGLKDLTGKAFPPDTGEMVIFAPQLEEGRDVQDVVGLARNAGWQVVALGTAVERTNKGGRTLLRDLGIEVKAVTQIADTPNGLVFERRAPDRWTT